jgi:hypothetical protein
MCAFSLSAPPTDAAKKVNDGIFPLSGNLVEKN